MYCVVLSYALDNREFRFDSGQVQTFSFSYTSIVQPGALEIGLYPHLNLTIRLRGVASCQYRSLYPHEAGGMLGPHSHN